MGQALPNTLLDIGAGGGEFVYAAQCSGLNAVGIEPNLGYSEFARDAYGVRIDTLDLDQVADRRVEMVTLFHVLEHMPKPIEVIEALYQIVKDDGWLFIEVPNIEQADASPSNIFFQAHLLYFSESSLSAIATSYFEPIYIESKGNLKILFKRRSAPIQSRLPRQEQVKHTLKRLDQKGWFEYLTMGGGVWKLARRVRQYWMESRLRGLNPSEIVRKALAD
jgi:SAM-dependent methyltransferase